MAMTWQCMLETQIMFIFILIKPSSADVRQRNLNLHFNKFQLRTLRFLSRTMILNTVKMFSLRSHSLVNAWRHLQLSPPEWVFWFQVGPRKLMWRIASYKVNRPKMSAVPKLTDLILEQWLSKQGGQHDYLDMDC